jgi:hypothetical protein
VKFFGIGSENENLIRDPSCRPFVRLELSWQTNGYFIPDADILECEITSLKEKTGGIVNSGTILLDNRNKQYSPELHPEFGDYMKIRVWYCLGSTDNTLMRF